MGEYGTIPPQGGPGDPKRPRSQRSHRSVKAQMYSKISLNIIVIGRTAIYHRL